VRKGGSKAAAIRQYSVTRQTLDRWLSYGDDVGQYRKPGRCGGRKVNDVALEKRIAEQPDILQNELAREFGVHESTIHYARKRLKLTRKRNVDVSGKKPS
jgi:hypothetical protein